MNFIQKTTTTTSVAKRQLIHPPALDVSLPLPAAGIKGGAVFTWTLTTGRRATLNFNNGVINGLWSDFTDIYIHSMSQPPRSNRAHRERNGDRRQRDPSNDGRSSSDRPSSRPPSYPRTASSRSQTVPREEHHESKCSHICSRRGIVLICSVLTNSLVLMCVIAAQMVTSGMTSMAAMGSFDINTNLNMEGTELQKARELDMQYSQMRAPGVYGGIPFVLIFGVTSLLFVLAGNKLPHVMSWKLLVGSLVFQAVGAVVYVVAVGLYLHFVIMVNSTDVCKQRERLYARSGYTWKNCDVGGADASVALFGLITAILYTAGAVLTFQTVRRVKRYRQDRKHIEEERQQDRENKQRAPPSWAATTVL